MTSCDFYIRFGVHRDRGVLKNTRDAISGICVPAHILSYSRQPTIAALLYIQKQYFIDPMTYIYASDKIADYLIYDKDKKKSMFKPSIRKMTDDFGLNDFFENRNYAPLKPSDFSDKFIRDLCDSNLKLQTEKIVEEKEQSIKRYADLLAEDGITTLQESLRQDLTPQFITSPYFYFSSASDEWLEINLKMADRMKEIVPKGSEVVPVILTNPDNLSEDILKEYRDFNKVILWCNDFNEHSNENNALSVARMKKLIDFVVRADKMGISIINLYGGYFSIILSKLGLSGICNGVFYSEHKSMYVSVGGVPPSRYYLRKIHRFVPVPLAQAMLMDVDGKSLLDLECLPCMDLINSDPEKIITLDKDQDSAKRHFMYSREMEIDFVRSNKLDEILDRLSKAKSDYSKLSSKYKGPHYLDYLDNWVSALEGADNG